MRGQTLGGLLDDWKGNDGRRRKRRGIGREGRGKRIEENRREGKGIEGKRIGR